MKTAATDYELTATLNTCVPGYARALNSVYNTLFNPINKMIDWMTTNYTRHLVKSFDKKI